MDKRKRKQIGAKKRFNVLRRDSFKCQYCGVNADNGVLHIDHVVPFASGGSDDIDNLITSCDKCNFGKSDTHVLPHEQRRDVVKTASRGVDCYRTKRMQLNTFESVKKTADLHDDAIEHLSIFERATVAVCREIVAEEAAGMYLIWDSEATE